jgi:pyruvate dehydrogenase E1 component alpha subunit
MGVKTLDQVTKEPDAGLTEAVTLLAGLYESMLTVRTVEESLDSLFSAGAIPGFIHLGIGQEATAVGVNGALGPEDTIASTHRGHGHALAKGMPVLKLVQEILGKEEGVCRGRGGSLHVADFSVGMLGANGIVGGGIPIALGSALAHKTLGTTNIAAVFFGDGALAEGVCYEAMNLAALWKLPLLFVCENNGWSEFSAFRDQYVGDLRQLSATFGIPFEAVDGNDVEAVHAATARIVGTMRSEAGPAVLECRTLRIHGHYQGDSQPYRDRTGEVETADPLERAVRRLAELGASDELISEIETRVRGEVASAIETAKSGAEPNFDDAMADVYRDMVPA